MKPSINCKHPSYSLPGGSILKLQLCLESENQSVLSLTHHSSGDSFQTVKQHLSEGGRDQPEIQSLAGGQRKNSPYMSLSFPTAPGRSTKQAATSKSYLTRLGKTLTIGGNFM